MAVLDVAGPDRRADRARLYPSSSWATDAITDTLSRPPSVRPVECVRVPVVHVVTETFEQTPALLDRAPRVRPAGHVVVRPEQPDAQTARDPRRPRRANGRAGGGAGVGSPGSYPATQSSTAAVSRTVRVMTCSVTHPLQPSPTSGPSVTRPRDGLSPTAPTAPAGLRIEPPPSPAWARATTRDATAAADPPLDPPTMRSGFHGLRVGPNVSGSVVGDNPSSGVFVLPNITKPAARNRSTRVLSCGETQW